MTSRPHEDLRFAVEEWTADQHVSEVLARASNVLVARAAFEEAARLRPTARLTLRQVTCSPEVSSLWG